MSPWGVTMNEPFHHNFLTVSILFYFPSQRVWMALELKKIPYRVEKVNMRCYGDKPASFTRMQPSGQIPVAIIDGKVYGQSDDILYALEELFDSTEVSTSLLPSPDQTERAQQLLRLERQVFGAWMYWLTGSGGSKDSFVQTLNQVEKELKNGGGPFFLGSQVSIVDLKFIPFLERMCASLLFYKGFQMRFPKGSSSPYPALNKYFDAMDTLPAYQLTKGDYYSHCWDLPPQLGGCTYEPGCEPFEKAINGEQRFDGGSGGSWELPLQPHNGGIEPDWDWCGDDLAARREAVERIVANVDALVRFSCRGAGRVGMPPVSAPLSDPRASPNESYYSTVETVLKIVSLALLDGSELHQESMNAIAENLVKENDRESIDGLVSCIAYLRDRIGVPRDMRLPAARNLRAHLNWSLGSIREARSSQM